MYFFSRFQQHCLQQVQLAVHIVDSVDSCTYCRQCRQFYPLTVQIAVPIADSVDSCTYCRQCRRVYLLQTVQKNTLQLLAKNLILIKVQWCKRFYSALSKNHSLYPCLGYFLGYVGNSNHVLCSSTRNELCIEFLCHFLITEMKCLQLLKQS